MLMTQTTLWASDVNKATGHKAKAKAKARDLKAKAKAKDFQHSPSQTKARHVQDQIKTSDVTYLLHSITVKIMIAIK